jgi:hypothetical protein
LIDRAINAANPDICFGSASAIVVHRNPDNAIAIDASRFKNEMCLKGIKVTKWKKKQKKNKLELIANECTDLRCEVSKGFRHNVIVRTFHIVFHCILEHQEHFLAKLIQRSDLLFPERENVKRNFRKG